MGKLRANSDLSAMPEVPPLRFGPYRLLGPQGPLLRGDQRLKLKPKALGVLWELARQAGKVVSKAALRNALWPNAVVGDDAIAFQIQALRQLFQDDAKKPRYISTCHRIGYSFVAPVRAETAKVQDPPESGALPHETGGDGPSPATTFVGRDAQLARLHQHYSEARRGGRQLVFVSGEAGIGKTTLVESFLAQVSGPACIGRGQCVEQHGAGEGYRPVLEALAGICRQPQGTEVIDVLRQIAPTWLMQLPALLSQDDVTALQPRVTGAGRERMLREIADVLEALTTEVPLILLLEDLHWSDPSTIEMLSLLARRSERAKLLVLGTYRFMNGVSANQPLGDMKRELVARGVATEIALGNLPPADVQTYLTRRFPESSDQNALSAFVYKRTEGHPLFMAQVADYLAQEPATERLLSPAGKALEAVVPQGLRELIEVQLGALTEEERRVLEMASVDGAEFTVASLGAGARMPEDEAETHCERLARNGQFIEGRGLAAWPDGTVSGRYAFRHALYQDVLYARLSARQQAQAHLAIGVREEAGYGDSSDEMAVELAVHFEKGRDFARAVHYCHRAGGKALRRSANAEAIAHFTRALDLLARLPASAEQAKRELGLQVDLSLALTMIKGYSASELERVNARIHELCHQMKEAPEISSALFRIERFHLVRGEIRIAREVGERLLRIARRAGSPALLSQAHTASAFESFALGDFAIAQQHAEQSIENDDPRRYGGAPVAMDDSSGVSHVIRAFALQVRGYPDQAKLSLQRAMALVERLDHPFATGGLLLSTADLHLLRRDSRAVHAAAAATIAHSVREGFPYYVARATILRGWALAEQGQADTGIADIRKGLETFEGMGARLWVPCCLGLLAEAYGRAGKIDRAQRTLSEALEIAGRTGEGLYEAELHRLKGELALQESRANRAAAEACFDLAIAVARRQDAKSYELRAAVSLARSWIQGKKRDAARPLLSGISGWFTEGFDTRDLRAAKTLLSEFAAERSA
jgi:DNA-binding winged helix-turn-helix (wHTH) protein/predicted ATPase